MENWVVYNKKADFQRIGRKFGIDQVTARIIRNRDITEEDEIRRFLYGNLSDLYDPHMLKDADRLTAILTDKIRQKKSIRVIGDYDIDGVMSTYILISALGRCGARADFQIPDRIIDGYGLNRNLIEKAAADGVDTILTCDNGIAALEEIALARELGMTVLVTDHHEIPFEETAEGRKEKKSLADAVVNAHQKDCSYPNKDMCGAAVAWKIVCLLYEAMGIPSGESLAFLENVAFATVGDIMSLKGENRILVREGLKRIHHTENVGMRALISQCKLDMDQVDAWHFGFVLGPCINATGRLDTANRAMELFLCKDPAQASLIAAELVALNDERKELTRQGVELARKLCESGDYGADAVLVLYLPQVHESIAGIIAGRIRELYYKPVFILTRGKEGVKGSGRSIETYSMYEELCKCSQYLTRFGGHPMAAGLSLREEDVEPFRRAINACCSLTEEDLKPKVRIDVPMPVDYVTMDLVREFSLLEPFGKDNPRPLFADRSLKVLRMEVIGKNRNATRFSLCSQNGCRIQAICFRDPEEVQQLLRERFGEDQLQRAMRGADNSITFSMTYQPKVNTFRQQESLQFEIQSIR